MEMTLRPETYVWEVIAASNLYPPYRYAQKYEWIEVSAPDQITAINKAAVEASKRGLEATDMVRKKTVHELTYGHLDSGAPAPVLWDLPVIADAPQGMIVRDPETGERRGYLGWKEDEKRFGMPLREKEYRLLVKRPSAYSKIIAVCPAVNSIEYSFLRMKIL